MAAGLAVLLVTPSALASPQSAERAFQKGDFATAAEQYAQAARSAPGDARLTFDLGTAAYKKGDFDGAAKAFESSLRSEDLGLQEQAYYGLGDASFRLGEATLGKNDVDATRGHWKQSVADYEGSLRLRPDDADAKYNLDLVKRRLADLEKKQEEQKQEQQQQDQQKKPQQEPKQKGGGKSSNDKGAGQSSPDPSKGDKDGKHGKGDKGQTEPQNGQSPANQGSGQTKDRDQQAGPGELSKADAEALLDSVRGDLRVTSRAPAGVKQPVPQRDPQKDW